MTLRFLGPFNRVAFTVVLMLGLTVFGCHKDENPVDSGMVSESQALQAQVAQSDSIAEFITSDTQILDDLDLGTDDNGGLGKAGSAATTIRWGRHIFWNRVERTIETALVGDTIANVTVVRTVPGELRIGYQVQGGSPGVFDSIVHKPFVLNVRRTVRFTKVAQTGDASADWRAVAISLVYGKTSPDENNTFGISSMEITGKYSTTITNPLDTWFRYGRGVRSGIPRFMPGDSIKVRVTLQSRNDSAEVVYLRHGFAGILADRHRTRMLLMSADHSAGSVTRVYERLLIASPLPPHILAARLSATVDVFSYSTLYDNNTAVSNEFWGVPYVVTNY